MAPFQKIISEMSLNAKFLAMHSYSMLVRSAQVVISQYVNACTDVLGMCIDLITIGVALFTCQYRVLHLVIM